MRNVLLAATAICALAGGLAGEARADGLPPLHVRCGGFTYFVGNGAPDPRDYVDVDLVNPAAKVWTIVYHLANGQVHSRNDQYAVADLTDGRKSKALVWGGAFHKNPKLFMIGALWFDEAKDAVTYSERLIDRSLGDKLVMSQSALCGPNPDKPPAIAPDVTAQSPAPDVTQTAPPFVTPPSPQGGDVVGLVSNGKAAAVKVYFGSHDATMLIDTGAMSLSLTPAFADELVQAGEAHYTGKTVHVILADGKTHPEQEIVVERVTIGKHTLNDVQGTVTGADGMMLLPFPVLNQMGKFTIDTRNNLLTFGD